MIDKQRQKKLEEDEIEADNHIYGTTLYGQEKIAKLVRELFPYPEKVLCHPIEHLEFYVKVRIQNKAIRRRK